MNKLITVITLFSSYLLLSPSFAAAAAYMKLGDIKGEAMEVRSVRWMAPEAVNKKEYSRAAKTEGGAQSGSLSITKELDKSSPKLQEMLNSGGSFGEITITEGDKNFLLKNVKVVSIEKKGKQEVVSLRFSYKQEFGPTRGADHNTTRSNRASSTKATDYNSSRSNRTTQ
ncbi:MAG: type VI secretion system tube protein Hcp [Verrucomicrobia bacterium]|nr:type VI secretion system tube protein Hcp [Verrucomicrobiota bacterium]MDA1067759.1 type VI secretion system tube protein Hcp [Verrucomicrobiota bacterium]